MYKDLTTNSWINSPSEDLDAKYKAQTLKLQEYETAILRVRELHFPTQFGFCGHCWSWNGEYDTLFPCDTIKALDGE